MSGEAPQWRRQSSQISGGGSPGASSNPSESGVTYSAPPPPPPPTLQGGLPTHRLNTEIGPKEPPAAVLNAMMSKDKKPFTYTPGGLDLSQLRSPRMQKRISRNAAAPGVQSEPSQSNASSPPVTSQPQYQPQIAVQVLPPPPPAMTNNQPPPPPPPMTSNFNSYGSAVPAAPPPPPPQLAMLGGGVVAGHPPITIPKHPVLRQTGLRHDMEQEDDRQRDANSAPTFVQRQNNPAPPVESQPPMTSRAQLGSLYIPPVAPEHSSPVHHVASPVSSPVYHVASPVSSPVQRLPTPQSAATPTLNKAPTPWMSQAKQTTPTTPPWAARDEPMSPPTGGTRIIPIAREEGTRIIPIQIEGREPPKQQQQQQYQQQSQQPGTRIIPIQIEGAAPPPPPPNRQQQQQQPKQQQQRIVQPVYQHNKFSGAATPTTPSASQQDQQGWPTAPVQSRSFRVLQKITDTDQGDDQEQAEMLEHQPIPGNQFQGHKNSQQPQQQYQQPQQQYQQPQPQYQQPQQQQQWGPQNTQGVPLSQLRKLQMNDDDRALMNKFKAQVADNNPTNEGEENPRYRGGHIPSRVFKMLDQSVPRGPTPGAQQHRVVQQQDDAPAQPYIPASQQQVQEPRKYTGGAIPSRSFRMLQAMTAPENCAGNTCTSPTAPTWAPPDPSYPPPQWGGYYPPPEQQPPYWDPYAYMAYVNEMNAAYGYPPIPYYYPQSHHYPSDSEDYSGYSSNEEMAFYFQRQVPFRRAPSRNGVETPTNRRSWYDEGDAGAGYSNGYESGERYQERSPQEQGVATKSRRDADAVKEVQSQVIKEFEEKIIANGKKNKENQEKMLTNGKMAKENEDKIIVQNADEKQTKPKEDEKVVTNGRKESEDEDSDTEVEDEETEDENEPEDDEESAIGIKAIRSVPDISVYKVDDEEDEEDVEEEDEDEEEEDEEQVDEDLPHQLSVIFEECSDAGSECSSAQQRSGTSSGTLHDDIDDDEDGSEDDDIDSEAASVTVRLPLKVNFTRGEGNEEVATLIVGDSQVNKDGLAVKCLPRREAGKCSVEQRITVVSPEVKETKKVEEIPKSPVVEPMLLETPVISEDEDTDEEEFEGDSDISVTFSIPSRCNSTLQNPIPEVVPQQEAISPADELDGYATCESGSDVSVCLSLKVKGRQQQEDESHSQSQSQSSSGSVVTVKSAGSETDCDDSAKKGFWESEEVVKEETVIEQQQGFWDTGKVETPSLEIDIHIQKVGRKPKVEEDEEEDEEDEEESSCSSDSSAGSCVKLEDIVAVMSEVTDVKDEVEEKKNDVETEASSEDDGEFVEEEDNIISKIYSLCVADEPATPPSSNPKKQPPSRDDSLSNEEDDSGVTSDMSRPISDTESESSRLQTKYVRASTHSRLYRLLQGGSTSDDDEDDNDDDEREVDVVAPLGALVGRRAHLTLPLQTTTSDPDSLSSSSGVNSPSSPTVTDRLVSELVQSLLQRKKGRRLKKLPMAKLHAAALRILQEDMDPYDTNSSEDNSPARPPYYCDYRDYYSTWEAADDYDVVPSRAFKLLTEHAGAAKPAGMIPGLWAKCPRVPSNKNMRPCPVPCSPVPRPT